MKRYLRYFRGITAMLFLLWTVSCSRPDATVKMIPKNSVVVLRFDGERLFTKLNINDLPLPICFNP